MVGVVTSSVKRLCDYEGDCKLNEGIDIYHNFNDVFVVF